MKKSLLSLSLLFSLWSFAVINFNTGNFSVTTPAKADEAKPTTAEKNTTADKKVAVTTVATMMPPLTPAAYPLSKDSEWSYFDLGTGLDATDWKLSSYDVSAWSTGEAPLGYGDPTKTVISYGPDAGNKYITSYFVRDMDITLSEVADMVEFGIRRDDGVIVYVNGVEVIRDNMPTGAINYLTNSASIIDGADEKRFQVFHLPKSIFQEGVNRIAVEMHNRDGQSSDLGFDMYIKDAPEDFVCEEGHIGCFTSIMPTSQMPYLIIPEEHKFQLLFKQGDAYMDGSGTVPGNHDFTGYVPMEGSSELGYLAVNHENNPGGVSILDMHLDEETNLWVLDNTQPVEFQNNDLVTTIRNCSGGVTPWGTIITAEENTSGGDANGDNYQDVGWLVEIDPVTAQVMEYGNGKQEKLWAMGRMNHENVVVSADGTTAYYGEDGGTHCVYKFVADNANDLSSGTVYVLHLDTALSSNEPTSSTATWIEVPNATAADRNTMTANAAALGGTAFNGVEDCEISPIDGKVYFTAKGLDRVYRFTDNGTTVSDFETFVGGMDYELDVNGTSYTEPWGDGNDNLTFDDKGNLWVLQDGGLNYIWVIRPNHSQGAPQVLLHSSMPAGSEPTGLTFTPDFKYGFFSVQHPNGSNNAQVDATFEDVNINASATVVIANRSQLGVQTPVADFSADDVEVGQGQVVTFTDLSTNNPTSWSWTFEGGEPATSTDANPTVTYAEEGTYNVTLVSTNVAGDSEANLKNDYIVVDSALGLEDTLKGMVSIYPNPTRGQVTVELNGEAGQDVAIEIYDLVGRKVAVEQTQSVGGSQKIDLNLTQFNEQVFIINIKVGEKSGSYKMIKVN
ncbi:DUF839 domain-containing protein [Flavobacterium alkalisoli]|uniref:DUF839 domain-containing protein n=1 Tax=Flavobacterium alkalisoli TaxID=2602769 RepID=A0A5B9FY31_9FLAO|nr:alkaline phosphatase PhoX [Flavobacterium alkalisoli]QEE49752.1 DUF839 domain-containing protein [Flavobacterium alkalisoli]